jgi:hypothetical protein
MDTKQKHIDYWKKQGRFIIDCNTGVFNNEEIEIFKNGDINYNTSLKTMLNN